MAQLTKAQYDTKYSDVAGEFATNGTGAITATVMREFALDTSDSLFTNKLISLSTSASGLSLQECSSSPLIMIDDVGATRYLSIHRISVSYDYGTLAYNFGIGVDLTFKIGSTTLVTIPRAIVNGGSDFIKSYTIGDYDGVADTGLTLTASSDCTTGNGTFYIKIYYSIENLTI